MKLANGYHSHKVTLRGWAASQSPRPVILADRVARLVLSMQQMPEHILDRKRASERERNQRYCSVQLWIPSRKLSCARGCVPERKRLRPSICSRFGQRWPNLKPTLGVYISGFPCQVLHVAAISVAHCCPLSVISARCVEVDPRLS